MKLKTTWESCEFFPESKEDREILLALYGTISFDKDVQLKFENENKPESLFIRTYM